LEEVLSAAHPRAARRPREDVEPYLESIGGIIALARLRHLVAFQRLEADLRGAMADLGFMRG